MQLYEQVDVYTDLSLVENPRPFLESIRATGKIVPLQNRNVVAVTGYEEALAVYADADHFSSVNSITGPLPDLPFAPQGDDISAQIEAARHAMPFALEVAALDGPDHQKSRSLLMKLFTPKKLKQLDDKFRATALQLVSAFADQGRVEFVSAFAYPYGALVITDLLGIPEEERAQFSKYLGGAPAGPIGLSDGERQKNPLVSMAYKLAVYISARRENPQNDLLTEFATATYADGSVPTVEEATRLACFLFGAGQDTTAKAISASLRILCEQPALQDHLRQNPDRIADFVEEVLRCEGSIKTTHRLCKRTTEVAGVTIKAGTTVMISNMAANSDPSRFDRPQAFEIDRPRRKEHLSFGRGAHTCAGAPLARAEIRMSLECMLDAFENLRLDESAHGGADGYRYHYEPSYIMRGLEELHLTFDRRCPA